MSTLIPNNINIKLPADARIAVVAARFNSQIVDELIAGCTRQLKHLGAADSQIKLHRVPGAFELPLAAKALAAIKKYHAVICLGAVIRGDTPHFDFVAGECARGIMQVSVSETLPIIFGVLTTNTHQQALDRIGGAHGHAGERAADAAAEMIQLLRDL